MAAILINASARIDDLARIAAHAGSADVMYRADVDQLVCYDIEQAVLDLAAATLPPLMPTAEEVRAEAQRRIIAICGATSLNGCFVKQLNATMRAIELNDIRHTRALTAEEEAEADALRDLANGIKAIRSASNALEPNPPADYTNEAYWHKA